MASNRLRIALAAATVLALSTAAVAAAIEPSPPGQQVSGQLVVAVVERGPNDPAATTAPDQQVAFIHTTDNKLLSIDAGAVGTVEQGSQVTATVLPATDGAPAPVTALSVTADPAAPVQPAAASQQVFVAAVTPAGVTADPALTSDVAATYIANASTYWSDESDGAITFAVAGTVPAYTSARTCSDYAGIWNEAAALFPAFTGTAGQHLALFLPYAAYTDAGCSYGLGTVGSSVTSGGYIYVSDYSSSVAAHELGHNMSLQHAQSFPDAAGESSTTENRIAYGNTYDIMGPSFKDVAGRSAGNLSVAEQARLGFIPTNNQVALSAAGSLTQKVATLDHTVAASASVPRMVTVVDPRNGLNYYLEYRPQVGHDNIAPWATVPGVLIERDSTTTANETVLVDTTKGSGSSKADQSLVTGQTWTSLSGGVRVTVSAADTAAATLTIDIIPVPVTPTVAVSAAVAYLIPGTVTASLLPATAAGTVVFSVKTAAGAWTTIGTGTVASGTATTTWTPNPQTGAANEYTQVKADFAPSSGAFNAASAVSDFTVAGTPTTTTLSASGNVVTVNVTAASGTPNGTVALALTQPSTGAQDARTVALSTGHGTVDLTGIADGTWQAVGTYTDDQAAFGYPVSASSTSSPVAVDVLSDTRTPSTVTATAAPTTLEAGTTGTVNVTVTATGVTPTGTITVTSGTTVIGRGTLTNGQAAVTVTPTTPSQVAPVVAYSGDTGVRPSSTTVPLTVTPRVVTITATSPTPIKAGQPVKVSVTTTLSGTTGATAAGTVTVTTASGAAVTASTTGAVTVTLPAETIAGAKTYTVAIAATETNSAASTTVNVTVEKVTPKVTLTVKPTLTAGVPVDATVQVTAPGLQPSGTFVIKVGTTIVGAGTLREGRATVRVKLPSAGRFTLTALYGGDGGVTSGTAQAITIAARAHAAISVWAPSQVKAGASIPISVTLATPYGTPTGIVQLRDGNTLVATGVLVDGRATLRVRASAGTHAWTVRYVGDGATDATSLTATTKAY